MAIIGESVIRKKVFIPEGSEVYPIAIFDYINANIIVFSALIVGVVVEIGLFINKKRGGEVSGFPDPLNVVRATTFFLSIGFLAGLIMVSGRFSDFFIFFSEFYLFRAAVCFL